MKCVGVDDSSTSRLLNSLISFQSLSSVSEDVCIRRLPEDKLGLGLRFEGGSRTNEAVRRLFVQYCDPKGPAGKTRSVQK